MWKLTIVIVAIFFSSEILSEEVEKVNPNIIGGKNARLGQFPHMVSLRYYVEDTGQYLHGCGGGIINTRWVLTVSSIQNVATTLATT